MNEDWKEKAQEIGDEIYKRHEKERERERLEEERKKNKRVAKPDWQLVELQKRFKCHVFHVPASRPTKYEDRDDFRIYWLDDWNSPGDLRTCNKCDRWTCFEHLHNGVCKTCAEKALKPWWLRWF